MFGNILLRTKKQITSCTMIINILNNFDISDIQSITSDNATNNIKCMELLKQNNFKNSTFIGCFEHILNLMIKTGVLKTNTITTKIRNIVNDVRTSPKLTMSLNNLADANSLKYYTLVNDVVTRWNSSYLVLAWVGLGQSADQLSADCNNFYNQDCKHINF
jgi:hypothetical protein